MSLRAAIEARCNALWYAEAPPPATLRPLAALYGRIADRRAVRQRAAVEALPLPVVVVGNITAGGAGKTPLCIELVERARARGLRPGVVSRGYGRAGAAPALVRADSDPGAVGDEPLLIARRTGAPVCVARDRRQAVQQLAERGDVDFVIADDGLQHYRMPRVAELCVVDGRRGLGNGWRLPAGPLREPEARLAACDLVAVNGSGERGEALRAAHNGARFDLVLDEALAMADDRHVPLSAFNGQRVHATAGIGDPERFFTALREAGLDVVTHPLADHEAVPDAVLAAAGDSPLLMTEKDAVKLPPERVAGRTCFAVAARLQWAGDGAARIDGLLTRIALRA